MADRRIGMLGVLAGLGLGGWAVARALPGAVPPSAPAPAVPPPEPSSAPLPPMPVQVDLSSPPGPPAAPVTAGPQPPPRERLLALVDQWASAVKRYQAFVADIAAGNGLAQEELQKIQDATKYAGTAASAVISVVAASVASTAAPVAASVATGAAVAAAGSSTVPIVGWLAAATAACVAFVAGIVNLFGPDGRTLSEKKAGLTLIDPSNRAPMSPVGVSHTGWIRDKDTPQGCYYWRNIPIWGPDLAEFEQKVRLNFRDYPEWEALKKLIKAYPYGDPGGAFRVEVLGSIYDVFYDDFDALRVGQRLRRKFAQTVEEIATGPIAGASATSQLPPGAPPAF